MGRWHVPSYVGRLRRVIPEPVVDLLRDQADVVSRAQILASGCERDTVRRLLARRLLVPVHPGVYVAHTGPPTWLQRAWAGVLAAGPGAALTHESALRAAEGPGRSAGDDGLIHVGVGRHRRVVAPAGVRVHRLVRFEERVQWNLGPPRLRTPDAALEIALAAPDELAAIAALTRVVQSRRTTARRMLEELASRPAVTNRRWLEEVLRDVDAGTCSVLERLYLERVERAHGRRPADGRSEARRGPGSSTAMSPTARCSSSSTAGWDTTRSRDARPTSIVTSTRPWRASTPGDCRGDRCTGVRAQRRYGWRCCSAGTVGAAHRSRAPRAVTSRTCGGSGPV